MGAAFIPYADHGISLEGFAAHPSGVQKRPVVILCHAWRGRDDFICEKAQEMANWGYVGFALDMYGKGVVGKSKEENAALKKPFLDDRHLLQRRVLKGLEAAKSLPYVDTKRIAVLGLGFGAVCALDLARSGADLRGAISIYGHFNAPPATLIHPIKAKILVLHGYDDPITPQPELLAFEKEMNDAGVDWQAHVFGKTMHGFVTPTTNDPASGISYHPVSAHRAWGMVHSFLDEIFLSRNGEDF